MMERPSILVTGGAGYIGSHCCSNLHQAGFNPVSFDNLSTGHRHFANWGPLVIGDIRNTYLLQSTMRDHRISAVMHFAAASSVGESVIDPGKYYSNNVAGTLSLLEAMNAAGCTKLVYSSTGAVYGEASDGLIVEDSPCEPVNPYGRTKLTVERMVADFMKASDLCAISLRYFNACGAGETGRVGELRDPETHLIPRAIMKLQGYLPEFAIFGTDYNTPDGTAIRDYIHVADLAQAHLLALNALHAGKRSGTYNLGTGKGYTVREIILAIEKATNRRVGAVIKDRRLGDPAMLVADAGAARGDLAFLPTHSDLETIVASAWSWHQVAHPAQDQFASAGV